VAQRLKGELRDYDRIGRYGGEEFLIALPGCSSKDSVRQAERLRGAIQEAPFEVAGARLTVTISAGVAVDEAGVFSDVNSLLQRSDLALYRAKHSGRNRVEFYTVETFSKLPEGLTLSAIPGG
jgi:diguanylate cyclase (GGDEF)-like protein